MNVNARAVVMTENGAFGLQKVELSDIVVTEPSLISFDGSTTNTGVSIIRLRDRALTHVIDFTRDKSNSSPVRYKLKLKKATEQLVKANPLILHTVYEEPFIGHISAVENLFMLKSFLEEMIIENEPELDYIKTHEVNNKRWKKLFVGDKVKLPNSTEEEKQLIRKLVVKGLPFMADCTQDVIDSVAIGVTFAYYLVNEATAGIEKKKIHKFKYEIEFIGAEDDDSCYAELLNNYSGPKSVIENGVSVVEIDSKTDFDKTVYETMGEEDKLVVVKFKSTTHSNLVLEHKIGSLAAEYPYLYALVYRKSRKS